MKKLLKKSINIALGVMYFPVAVLSYMLHLIARLLLSLSYFGMLETKMGKDVWKILFSRYYR